MSDVSDQYHLFHERCDVVAFLRQYIYSVICVAIVCTIGQHMAGGKNGNVKFATGLILIIAVISPLVNIDRISFDNIYPQITENGNWIVAEGKQIAMEEASGYIREQTESYILNVASELGANIRVNVDVSKEEPMIPVSVHISGKVSPYAKECLKDSIRMDLGISEENQVWIS